MCKVILILDKFFLKYEGIGEGGEGGEGVIWPQKKLPSKSLALLGLSHRLTELYLTTRKLPESKLATRKFLGLDFKDVHLAECIWELLLIIIATGHFFGVTLANINRQSIMISYNWELSWKIECQ